MTTVSARVGGDSRTHRHLVLDDADEPVPIHWLCGLGRPVALPHQLRQRMPGRDGVGLVGAEDAFTDGKCALEEGAGGGRVALVPVQEGEVVEGVGGVGVVVSQYLIADPQGTLEERLSGVQLTSGLGY